MVNAKISYMDEDFNLPALGICLITAINDPAIDVEYICYLIKFDSTHGKFNGNVNHTINEIIVDDTRVKVFHEKLPSNVPWQTADVQYVVEACGMFTSLEKASGHLASDSVKRVIVTAPSVDVPMVILGVNHTKLQSEQKVISCASSTLYCLAPIIKILEDKFGVEEGFVTSIHAMTPSLKPLDGLCLRGKHWRDHRSIHQNIIPATTGACRALGKIIPQVKDKLSGLAFRVPIVNVSVLDLSIRLIKNTSLRGIVSAIDELSSSTMENLLTSSKDEAVSSDFIGDSHSCILDVNSSLQLKPNFFKLVCWYENEFSYACRVIDSIIFSEKQLHLLEPVSKMTYVRPRPSKKRDMVQQTECSSNAAKYDDDGKSFEYPKTSSSSPGNEFMPKPIRPIVLRKPLSNHVSGSPPSFSIIREAKRRNETSRAWNNDNEILKPALHQNKGALFHSCIEIMPKSMKQITNFKAQQHLEKVKKEFTKMVNITEDLLRKSDSNKFQANLSSKSLKRGKTDNIKSDFKQELNIFHTKEITPHKMVLKNPILKVSGDFESHMENGHSAALVTCNEEQMSSCNEVDNNISDYTISDKGKEEAETAHFSLIGQQFNRDRQDSIKKVSNDVLILPIPNTVYKKPLTKITKTLQDGLNQSIDMYYAAINQSNKSNTHIEKEVNQPANMLHEILTDNDSGFTSPSIKCPSERDDTSDQNILSEQFNNNKTEEKFDIKITYSYPIINELENTVDSTINADVHTNDKFLRKLEINTVNRNNKLELPKKILERLNRYIPDPIVVISDHRSKTTNLNNTMTNNESNRKQDIYDKLDSASATDSDNSFQINERKSQVIHITDITNSLEDLARLDKICRIIEISDELSDKLFSNLDGARNIGNKKWSFKDLCEKIKLDEFCNKLFGK